MKNFKTAAVAAILDTERNNFSNSESLTTVTVMPPIKFRLNLTFVWEEMPWRPSWISERNDFSNSESLCHRDASYQVSAQSDRV